MTPQPPSFATVKDYEARKDTAGKWGDRLQMKLDEASRMIVDVAPHVPAWIEEGRLYAESVTDIVCEMVARAVPLTDMGIPQGVESAQMGVDVFQQSLRFGSQAGGGSGALYISKQERKRLGIGTQRAFTVQYGGHVETS